MYNFEFYGVDRNELRTYTNVRKWHCWILENVQCAFQKGFEDVFGKCEETILPEKDIDQFLNGKGSVAYKAVLDGETVGGVIVSIDTETQHNHPSIQI